MPSKERDCHFCGRHVSSHNYTRHKYRKHGIIPSRGLQKMKHRTTKSAVLNESLGTVCLSKSFESSSTSVPTNVHGAVISMLQCTTNVSLPELTKFLTVHFPYIPVESREVIIVAAFAAAHVVAATHGEITDSGRNTCAKQVMKRWMCGIHETHISNAS